MRHLTEYIRRLAASLPENRVVDMLQFRGLVYERITKTHDRLQQLNLWRLLLLGGIVRFWLWEEDITAMSLSMGWESASASRGPQESRSSRDGSSSVLSSHGV
jgi:hypothetical protein